MNDSQKILHEFNRQRSRVLETIAARDVAPPAPSGHDPRATHPVTASHLVRHSLNR